MKEQLFKTWIWIVALLMVPILGMSQDWEIAYLETFEPGDASVNQIVVYGKS
ncbi:MAG: hypothetical protein AAF798_08640 [Bacteroidota bacterium]